jgi:sulfatase maturation enzyme AslB (radical SAM superfamily)
MINKIDKQFSTYFRSLKQVFLYITDNCNLECQHCIYKPNVKFGFGNKEISFAEVISLISDFREMGASKLSILGGEPTLYGMHNNKNYEQLLQVIEAAKDMGYEYIRIVTNGTFQTSLLYEKRFQLLNEISFSLDGYDEITNDAVRKRGVFKKAVNNIKVAKKLGFEVHITTCVYNKLLEKDSNNEYLLERVMFLGQELNVQTVNFHVLINDGTPIETWQGGLFCSPALWQQAYYDISQNILNNKYKVHVRIPPTFISEDEFNSNKSYYGFCPVKLGERLLVHPDGILRICSALLASKYGIATFNNFEINWNNTKTNELTDHKLGEYTPCTNRGKVSYGKDRCVLCFSFKPDQDEHIWKHKTQWDQRKTNIIVNGSPGLPPNVIEHHNSLEVF